MAVTIGNDMKRIGYGRLAARQEGCSRRVKQKHCDALVEYWKAKGLSHGTIRNRLSFLRSVTSWTGRPNVVRSNAGYGVQRGQADKTTRGVQMDKSVRVGGETLEAVPNRYSGASFWLQKEFGLRREEALKIQPGRADRGNRLVLEGSWCKNGRDHREIAIKTPEQRQAVDFAKEVAGKGGSLIPPSLSYVQYRDGEFRHACDQAGLNRTHGMRHAWAQDRYLALTGWECPVRGGPTRDQMTPDQVDIDRYARRVIAEDLGHGRPGITNLRARMPHRLG